IRADIDGAFRGGLAGSAIVSGSARMRGFMATKYLNFFTTERMSAGLGLGGGVGRLDASFTRQVIRPVGPGFSEFHEHDYTVPFFEIIGRVDVRVARNLTIGPFYGVRNGMIGGGVCVRVHFLR